MKYFILSFALFLTFSGNGLERTTSSRSPLGIELIAKDGSLRARVFLSSERLLVDFPVQQRAYLFKAESYVYLNRSGKTYRDHSYANLWTQVPKSANSDTSPLQNEKSAERAAGFEFTGETDVIAGFGATRIVRSSQGKVEMEMWVCEEIPPAALKAVRRQMRATFPMNYWNDDNPGPTLLQAIFVFGLPLRIIDHKSESSEVEAVAMKNVHIPDDLFEVPLEYRQSEP